MWKTSFRHSTDCPAGIYRCVLRQRYEESYTRAYDSNLRMLVGGEVLDLALARAKPHARFVICGGELGESYGI